MWFALRSGHDRYVEMGVAPVIQMYEAKINCAFSLPKNEITKRVL